MATRIVRINYGVNRDRSGGRIEHKCGKLRWTGEWESEDSHRKIMDIISKKHPGWNITGYALA